MINERVYPNLKRKAGVKPMTIKQLSIFIENKPGCLCEVAELLENNQIDIRALSLADTTDFGILRIIVDAPDQAKKVLKEGGFTVSLTEVIAIGVEDKPGGLSKALHILLNAGIAVEYMYAFLSKQGQSAYVIFRVEDNEAAVRILKENNVPIVESEDIYAM